MLDRVLVGLGALGFALLLTGDQRRASDYPPAWSRQTCGAVCTVTRNDGGYVEAFLRQAKRVVRDRITLRIDGPCASACTMAADRARPYACVTQRAVMRFHNFYDETVLGISYRGDPSGYYRTDIVAWVKAHGGFPGATPDDSTLLDMPFQEARKFWRACA